MTLNPAQSDSSVCAIVVTYNRLDLLKETVTALSTQTRSVEQILIVNNGSTDGTGEWLATQPNLMVITQDNLGGAGGFHAGIKQALKLGFAWTWSMDDDVAPAPDALERLTTLSVFRRECGFLTGRVVTPLNEPINVPTLDTRPGPNGAPTWVEQLALGIIPIRTAAFVSVLLSSDAVRQVGLPIKEMFIWGDDTEFTYRLSKVRPCYVVGASVVVHKRASAQNLSVAREPNLTRIPMYALLFRNNLYWMLRERAYKDLAHLMLVVVREVFACLASSQAWLRISTIFKGLAQGLTFHPSIEFPAPQAT